MYHVGGYLVFVVFNGKPKGIRFTKLGGFTQEAHSRLQNEGLVPTSVLAKIRLEGLPGGELLKPETPAK